MNTENAQHVEEHDDIMDLASSANSSSQSQSNPGDEGSGDDKGDETLKGEESKDTEKEVSTTEVEKTEEVDSDLEGTGEEKKVEEEETPSFDLAKYLEEHSGGVVKSEEDFKSSITKLQNYDELEAKVKQLEAEKETIFANDEIKLWNDLSKEGKTEEQIEEFRKLRKLGDLSAVEPKEVLIQDLISKGMSRSVAEVHIEREYGLDKLNLNADDLTDAELEDNKKEIEHIERRMQLAADPIRKGFQERIEALSKPVDQTEQALAKAAAEKAYKAKLTPFVEQLSNDFPSKVEIVDGLNFDVPAEFKENVKSIAFDHFLDKEVNNETVGEFINMQKAVFFAQNKEKIFKAIHDKGYEKGKQDVKAEFVNNNGLQRTDASVSKDSEKMSEEDFITYANSVADD